MIERVSAPILAGVTVAAAAVPQPVIWSFLGHPFDAASMVAALFAAMTTRVIIGLRNRSVGLALDAAILVLVLVTTAAVVASYRTNMVGALLLGTGLGTIGEGILRIAEKWTNSAMRAAGIDPPAPPPGTLAPEHEDHPAAISAAMGTLKRAPPISADRPPLIGDDHAENRG